MNKSLFARFSLFVTLFSLIVIVVGAYVRLSDAGLGCPDWPGCYGHLDVPEEHHELQAAAENYERPVEVGKAWKEMIHRYLAGALGLLIVALAIFAHRAGFSSRTVPNMALGLVGLVIFQALLGMWTVTLMVKPFIVTMHLIFGMTTMSMLWLLTLNAGGVLRQQRLDRRFLKPAWLVLLVVVIQIFLGGWTSTNYAALACSAFPGCYVGEAWPAMDFAEGFVLWRGLGVDYEFGVLSQEARAAVHMTHRLGAVVVLLVVGWFALSLMRFGERFHRSLGQVIGVLLLIQLTLGVLNVVMGLPLLNAVAHNGGAALLVQSILTAIFLGHRWHSH